MAAKPKSQPRPREEIAVEYARVCAEIGDHVYRRDVGIPSALDALYRRAKALNLEAAAAKQSNPKAKE